MEILFSIKKSFTRLLTFIIYCDKIRTEIKKGAVKNGSFGKEIGIEGNGLFYPF